MATRILRAASPAPARPYLWPQFGRPVQEIERQLLESSPVAVPADPPPAGPPGSAAPGASIEALEASHRAELDAARNEAFQRGLEEGRRQAALQLESSLARLARSLEELAGLKPRLRAEAERGLVELSLAIARRVLRRELHIDPEAVLGLVKAALEKAALREVTEVRLHPAHAAAVRSHLARIGAPQAIQIREDPSLEAGAVLVETARGAIDASLETQLDEIGRGLADALGGAAQ